jgi:hypothetical protein
MERAFRRCSSDAAVKNRPAPSSVVTDSTSPPQEGDLMRKLVVGLTVTRRSPHGRGVAHA